VNKPGVLFAAAARSSLDLLAQARANHMPYKGAAQALTDVIGGQLQYLVTSPLVAMPHAKGGRIKVMATTGAKRDPLIPELPTVADTVAGYDITQWWGVVVPAPIAARLHAELVRALQSPDVRDLVAKQGACVQPESPAEFSAFMRAERARITNLGKQADIRLDD
jgi:tripartite-type tricarboxylate transporter receptor subunit TctC